MRHAVLALLADRPAHGYEIKRGLEEQFGAVIPPLNAGQVSTTLQRLQRDELVADDAVAQSGRPDKRVYRLTDAGGQALEDWLGAAERARPGCATSSLKLVLAQSRAWPTRRADRPPARRTCARCELERRAGPAAPTRRPRSSSRARHCTWRPI